MENVEGHAEESKTEQSDVSALMARLNEFEDKVNTLSKSNARLLDESKEYKTKYQSLKESNREDAIKQWEQKGKMPEVVLAERKKNEELTGKVKTLQQQALLKDLHVQVATLASDAIDVGDAMKLIPSSMLQSDPETGTWSGVEDAVNYLRENKPHMFQNKNSVGMVSSRPSVDVPKERTWADLTDAEKDARLVEAFKEQL